MGTLGEAIKGGQRIHLRGRALTTCSSIAPAVSFFHRVPAARPPGRALNCSGVRWRGAARQVWALVDALKNALSGAWKMPVVQARSFRW
jgi:hypothetical protein